MNTRLSIIIVSILTTLIMFISCDNTLELTSNTTNPFPIVHAVLDLDEEYQYIRVEKSFIDNEKSPEQLAMDPNNLYYDNIEVVVIVNDQKRVVFEKINGEDYGLVREDGVFATAPNILYRAASSNFPSIHNKNDIKLQLEVRDAEEIIATAETHISDKFEFTFPNSFGGSRLPFVPGEIMQLSFRKQLEYKVFDLFYVFHFEEEENGIERNVSVEWQAVNKGYEQAEYSAALMYQRFNSQLLASPSVERVLDSISVYAYGYDQTFSDYVSLDVENNGITATSDIPVFTNIEGGYGIFTHRLYYEDTPFEMTPPAQDSLMTNSLTKDLNITFR